MSLSTADYDNLDKTGSLTSMLLVLLGNYAQTGHFGGPLSYTPANVILHLAGATNGGLAYDIRDPKNPICDKYMLAGGHCAPTNYALWIILYEALKKHEAATKDEKYKFDENIALLAIDALGFRRSEDAVKDLLEKNGLTDDETFGQHKIRGIRALMGHSETTDVTNDVNGGPSGIGVATAVGRAMFWDAIKAPEDLKVITFEGEFAFTEGHAQELKTLALAQQVGKRLRLFFSYNNAGIDDSLVGGVVHKKYADKYDIAAQFESYGWNVFKVADGGDYKELVKVFKEMEDWPQDDRRPMVVVATTIKGWWPQTKDGKITGGASPDQIIGYKSHPYGYKTNCDYFVSLAESFEKRFNVEFKNIRNGKPANEKQRLTDFITNVNVCLSVLDQNDGELRKWVATRLVDSIATDFHSNRVNNQQWKDTLANFSSDNTDLFQDERLKVANLPTDSQTVTVSFKNANGETTQVEKTINLFLEPGKVKGTRRAISELGKYLNYISGNKFYTIAADLSNSINVENSTFTGHYDPVENPSGTRMKAGIQECCNAAAIAGLCSQTLSNDSANKHVGVWGVTGTYGAFTPLMYTPLRIFSQQNQDSPFKLGVVTVVAGHSGPETAADGRSHFGIFAPQVWQCFPRHQIINLYFWDYNDVAPGYFAALEVANARKETGIICIHVARPDFAVADRSTFADTDLKAAAKGCYVIREYDQDKPKHGTVYVQGSSSTVNLIKSIPDFEKEGLNIRIVSVISEDLFLLQSQEYQDFILSDAERFDSMFITTSSKRFPPLTALGPFASQYSLASDHDNRWRTGGLEPDVIAEAHLDQKSIFEGVKAFALDRENRINRIKKAASAF